MAKKTDEKSVTRDIPSLSLRASVTPNSINKDARTAEVTFSTGARVRRTPWFDEAFDEELSLDPAHVRMDRLKAGAPLLDSHRGQGTEGVVGVIETASVDGKTGRATVRFGRSETADRVFQDVADGILRNVSVGYRVHKFEKQPKSEGEAVPVYRAIDWEPHEISVVAISADAGASIRGAAGVNPNACELITREQLEMKMDPKEEKKIEETPVRSADEIAKAAVDAERERSAEIRKMIRIAKLDGETADRLVTDGVAVDAARKLVLEKMAERDAAVKIDGHTAARVSAGEDASEKFERGMTAWLIQKAGVQKLVRDAAEKSPEMAKIDLDPGEFRGMSLIDVARDSLHRRGVKTRGLTRMEIAGLALQRDTSAGISTTTDFPKFLENILHKILLAQYAMTPDTWTRFCATGSNSDFRASNRYRPGTFGSLDSLNEAGEYKSKSIPDGEKQSITLATKGNIIAISRQALVNDDMGAFNSLATMFGRAAKLSIEKDVYALLAQNAGLGPTLSDSVTMFHASSHGANATTGSAISVVGLDADRVAMGVQTDPSGNEILDLKPYVLVVPLGLLGTAQVINDAQYDPDTASKLQRPNMVRGLFADIVGTGRMTGTRRYLFADPSVAPCIEVAFLDGQQTPVLETQQGFRSDGVEWKVRLDYGVGGIDFRGGITNAGV